MVAEARPRCAAVGPATAAGGLASAAASLECADVTATSARGCGNRRALTSGGVLRHHRAQRM
jgi:hypothetical protein